MIICSCMVIRFVSGQTYKIFSFLLPFCGLALTSLVSLSSLLLSSALICSRVSLTPFSIHSSTSRSPFSISMFLSLSLSVACFFPSFKDSYYDISLRVPTFLPAIISIPFRLLQHIYFPTMNVFLKILLRL